MTERHTGNGYIPTLDGWRALAILGVLICHGVTSVFRVGGPFPQEKLAALCALGAFGVPVFFVLSGFLITFRLLQERQRSGEISLRRFYLRRACRILPAAGLYLMTILILERTLRTRIEPATWLGSIFFYKNWVTDRSWYLSHFWSLSMEEQFYLLWPALVAFLGLNRLGITTFLLATGFVLAGDSRFAFQGLLAGAGLASLLFSPIWRERLRLGLTPAVFTGIATLFLAGVVNKIPFREAWLPIAIALLIAATALNPERAIGRLLERRPLQWVGRISYSLYLWQQVLCLMHFEPRPFGRFQEAPLNILGAFLLGTLSYYWVEQPIIRWGRRFTAPPLVTSRGRSAA